MTDGAADRRIATYYDKAWSAEALDRFDDYSRNRLLARVTRDWEGAGKSMVDIGCGPGIVAQHFFDLGYDVSGIDASPLAVEMANQRGIGQFVVGNVERALPFADSCADVVFWGDNVEHLIEPQNALREIRRILRPNGCLIVTCPNLGYWKFRLIYLMRGSLPRTEGHLNPPWAWEHIRFFTPSILRDFLADGGFTTEYMTGTREKDHDVLSRCLPSLCASILLAVAQPSAPSR